MTDLETFILDNSDTIFRYLVYKRVYTPYEQDKKYSDESIYEDGGMYTYARINTAIELPDGDVLLGFNEVDPDTHRPFSTEHFFKLSEIKLSKFDYDQYVVEYEEDE